MRITEKEKFGQRFLQLAASDWELGILISAGPRVAWWGRPGGENLLFWDETGQIGRKDWKLWGGHRIWLTRPLADETEECYHPEPGPCVVESSGETTHIWGQLDPENQLRFGLAIRPAKHGLELIQGIKNEGPFPTSAGIWELTCAQIQPGTELCVPLGDGSNWDRFRLVFCKRWNGNEARINDPQVVLEEEYLQVKPMGQVCKRMLEAPQGMIWLNRPDLGLSFLIKTDYEPHSAYPLGCNLGFYIGPGNFMLEMETMGPERIIKPGETLSHTEKWVLTPACLGLGSGRLCHPYLF
jgi:hypothetical protein